MGKAIWEFMRNYAESFWQSGEYAFNIFSVIMAWAITIGFAFWLCAFIAAGGIVLGGKIREINERKKQ